jgi:hypothetical protein
MQRRAGAVPQTGHVQPGPGMISLDGRRNGTTASVDRNVFDRVKVFRETFTAP